MHFQREHSLKMNIYNVQSACKVTFRIRTPLIIVQESAGFCNSGKIKLQSFAVSNKIKKAGKQESRKAGKQESRKQEAKTVKYVPVLLTASKKVRI